MVCVARDIRVLPPLLQQEEGILGTARAQDGAAIVKTRRHKLGRQTRNPAVEDKLAHTNHSHKHKYKHKIRTYTCSPEREEEEVYVPFVCTGGQIPR